MTDALFSLYELSKHVVKSVSVLYNGIPYIGVMVRQYCGMDNNRMLARVIDL